MKGWGFYLFWLLKVITLLYHESEVASVTQIHYGEGAIFAHFFFLADVIPASQYCGTLICSMELDNYNNHVPWCLHDIPLKLSRVEPGQYLDGRPPEKTRLLLEEVLVRPAGGAHPVVCVGPNAPV